MSAKASIVQFIRTKIFCFEAKVAKGLKLIAKFVVIKLRIVRFVMAEVKVKNKTFSI
ncbi:MAG: hypothetical protein SOU27_07585 [Sodaliphilus sp.]|nr:hypothetical protein [Sodaliphilus sp.]